MRSPISLASGLIAVVAMLSAPACGSSEPMGTGGAGGTTTDGKVHPAGNGQHQSEKDACKVLSDAQSAKIQALSCIVTTRPCPSLIQVMVGGTSCLEYDQGSAQGCADYYAQQTTCDALADAIDACVVTSFTNSAPAGCP